MTVHVTTPDKFKGSLTAIEVVNRIAAGLRNAGAKADTFPIPTDGVDSSVAAALAPGMKHYTCAVAGSTRSPKRSGDRDGGRS